MTLFLTCKDSLNNLKTLSLQSKYLLTNNKMRKIYFFIITIALFGITSCSQDEDVTNMANGATRQTSYDNNVVNVKLDTLIGKSATFVGYLQAGNLSVKSKGFVISSTNSNPVIGGLGCMRRSVFTTGDTIRNTFAITITDRNYYFRGFIITAGADTIYSNIDSVMIASNRPTIETLPVTNRVKVAAVVLGKLSKQNDVTINSFGICLNTKGYPSLSDKYIAAVDTATDTNYDGQFGVFFDDLTKNTMYHVRAYCVYTLNNEKDTIYGNDRIFKTTLGGDVQWSWGSKSGDATVDDRIAEAMDSAMYYYNTYSNLYHRITANYNSGVPTAQCNILGDMTFGAVARYQWVGTAQHEISHAMGVGTAGNWASFGNPWSGPIATMTQRVMLKDMSEKITKDTQHFWPGGINQREEVTTGTTNTKGQIFKDADMLKMNAMILNAMREDGLYGYYE